MTTTCLLIYGTVKRDYSRSHLLDGQKFIGEVHTAPRYRLLSVHGRYPAIVELPRPGVAPEPVTVTGELWRVDEHCLAVLDEVEGVPSGLFDRRVVDLMGVEEAVEAYFWAGDCDGLQDRGATW